MSNSAIWVPTRSGIERVVVKGGLDVADDWIAERIAPGDICVTNDIPVVFVVQNNAGYMSIRGGQRKIFDRHVGSEFNRPDGSPYSPDFKTVASAFGLQSYRVEDPATLQTERDWQKGRK